MRLGDLDALKEDFDVAFFNDYDDYKKALRIIDNAPTVPLFVFRERQKSKWITDSAGNITCSNCGFSLGSKVLKLLHPFNFPYCPDCGADMQSNKKETTFDDYLKEQLKDPEFRKEYEKLCDEDKQKGGKENG